MASASAASDFHRGRRVGKYEILTRLSIGGMAELYLAFLPGPGGFKKFVALKQILPDVKADESFVKMFLDEARITAAFNHANIGQVFDLGEDAKSKELYLAMEFIAGQNLEQTVKRSIKREAPLPVGYAARVIRDTCLALHYAHAFVEPSTGHPMPVVHRDVSPKNVMITYTGDVKVIDFGIAKARGRLNRTQIGIVKGTSGYMSPEQVRNEALDGRSDLFATAVMLWELLAGERCFTAPSDAAMMLKIVDADAPPVIGLNPAVPQALSDVVAKGLARKREQRFATGKEFARAIEQACPELYEEEQVGALMSQLFDDKVAITRALFDQANKGEEANVEQVAEALRKDEGEGTPRPRKAQSNASGKAPTATPAPRPGLATPKAGVSSRNLPKVSTGGKSASSQNVPKVSTGQSGQGLAKAANKSSQRLPKVGEKKPAPRRDEDADTTLPPRPARAQEGPTPRAPRQAGAPTESGAPTRPGDRKKAGGGALVIGALAVLVVLAGGAWAVSMGPLKDSARAWLDSQQEKPIDPSAKPIDPLAPGQPKDKPAWLKEKEAQEKALADEREKQRQIEEAASDPESVKRLEEIQARLADLDRMEAEQQKLKQEAAQGSATGAANSKKIDDLQKQIDEMKALIAEKKAGVKGGKNKGDEVEVVRDDRSAKNASVGYVTLRTVNPSSTAVYDGSMELGSTPLVKVPLDVGVHRLRVVDSDSKSRMLSVTVEAGKTADFKGIDVASLPLMR